MEAILTKTYTQEELISIYNGDTLIINDELITEFKVNNPGAVLKSFAGEQIDNGDETFTYELTIEYDNI